MYRRAVVALVIATLTASPAAAQAGVTGTWNAAIPDVVRNEDGVQTVERTTTAVFELLARGDSITGTLRRGASTVRRPLRGIVRGDEVTFQLEVKAQANVNGVDHVLQLVSTYRLRLSGDTLRGTSETRRADPKDDFTLPGVEQDPLPVVAVRERRAPGGGAAPRTR